jgi:hypothetical protein
MVKAGASKTVRAYTSDQKRKRAGSEVYLLLEAAAPLNLSARKTQSHKSTSSLFPLGVR